MKQMAPILQFPWKLNHLSLPIMLSCGKKSKGIGSQAIVITYSSILNDQDIFAGTIHIIYNECPCKYHNQFLHNGCIVLIELYIWCPCTHT